MKDRSRRVSVGFLFLVEAWWNGGTTALRNPGIWRRGKQRGRRGRRGPRDGGM